MAFRELLFLADHASTFESISYVGLKESFTKSSFGIQIGEQF